jgi:hypothetical protein
LLARPVGDAFTIRSGVMLTMPLRAGYAAFTAGKSFRRKLPIDRPDPFMLYIRYGGMP